MQRKSRWLQTTPLDLNTEMYSLRALMRPTERFAFTHLPLRLFLNLLFSIRWKHYWEKSWRTTTDSSKLSKTREEATTRSDSSSRFRATSSVWLSERAEKQSNSKFSLPQYQQQHRSCGLHGQGRRKRGWPSWKDYHRDWYKDPSRERQKGNRM